MAQIGEYIGGRYYVVRILGRGGTATVYLVREERSGVEYALKEIPLEMPLEIASEKLSDTSFEKQSKISSLKTKNAGLMAELCVKEKLFHPSLAHLWRVWEQQGHLYLLMDYVKGVPLDKVLEQRGALPQEMAVELALQLGRVLVYLHGFQPPVIYRDMKPANIILQEDGKVKLIDFGAIRQLKRFRRRDTIPLGTPGYAAPEQFGKWGRSDVRSDIYALGVTLYQMLTGHDPSVPPYRICPIREWNKSLSPTLEKIVAKCTRRLPLRRYQNCEAFLKALEGYLEADRRRPEYKVKKFLEKFS